MDFAIEQEPCCHPECGRPGKYMITPECDRPGHDCTLYACGEHLVEYLGPPEGAKGIK